MYEKRIVENIKLKNLLDLIMGGRGENHNGPTYEDADIALKYIEVHNFTEQEKDIIAKEITSQISKGLASNVAAKLSEVLSKIRTYERVVAVEKPSHDED